MNVTKKEEIKLSDHFNYKRILKFTFPSIIMMVFTSIYGVVDGIFVSNFVGETQFAALNLIMPFIMVFGAIGTMLGIGGSALVAFILGTKDNKKANEIFSLIIYLLIGLGFLFMIVGILFSRKAAIILGASKEMLPYCVLYARISFLGAISFTLQYAFQSFFIVAEKPRLGLYTTIGAGVTNMLLDFILIGLLDVGLAGAAIATISGTIVGGIFPIFYFFRENSSLLRLGKTRWYGREILKAITNGSSEFMANVSLSLVNMLYNMQLMKYVGETGVSAYGIIMYTNFIFIGTYFGFAMGVSPIIGYNYGANNKKELKNVFSRSVLMILVSSVMITSISLVLSRGLALIFASKNQTLLDMTTNAIRIYSISYLFAGFNIFGSSLFTALNNGKISAIVSFLRALVFQVIFVLYLPIIMGVDGIWFSIDVAEFFALLITTFCVMKYRKNYGYI